MPGVFQNINESTNPRVCFVMMPFADSFDAIYRLIERCCDDQGPKCVRADSDVMPGKITNKIYSYTKCAGVIVADMTGKNPNVFYELGLAHAISDNVILLAQSSDDIPFDLKDFLHIRYSNTFDGAEKLASALSKVLTNITRSAIPHAPVADPGIRQPIDASPQIREDVVDLGMVHMQAELARTRGDMTGAREFMLRAQRIAQGGDGDASEIGNCAIEAERCKFRAIAEDLYERAIARDPNHVNNLQCYVSFILDEYPNDQNRLERAAALLDTLEGLPERRQRTMALRAQYASKTHARGKGTPEDLDDMMERLVSGADFTSLRSATPVLIALQETKHLDKFRAVIEEVRQHVGENEAINCDRILADALAAHGEEVDRNEAITLYESILSRGNTQPDLKHNLATLLMSQGTEKGQRRASELWREAYQELRGDTQVRRSFAQCLMRLGRLEDAQKVLNGQDLT